MCNLKENASPSELKHLTLLKKSTFLAHGCSRGLGFKYKELKLDYDIYKRSFTCNAGCSPWNTGFSIESRMASYIYGPTSQNDYTNDDLSFTGFYFDHAIVHKFIDPYFNHSQSSQFIREDDAKKYNRNALVTENKRSLLNATVLFWSLI